MYKWILVLVFCFLFNKHTWGSSLEIRSKSLKNTEVSVFVYEKDNFYLVTEGRFSKKGSFRTEISDGRYYFVRLKGVNDKTFMLWGDAVNTKIEVNINDFNNSIIKGSPQNVFIFADYERIEKNDKALQPLREQFLKENPDCYLADIFRLTRNFENRYFSWYTIPGDNVVKLKENYNYDSLITTFVKVGDGITLHPVYLNTIKEVFYESEKEILYAKQFLTELLNRMNPYKSGYDFLCKELYQLFKYRSSEPHYDALYLDLLEKHIQNKSFLWLSSSDSLNALYEVRDRANVQLYTYAKDISLRDSTFKKVNISDAVSEHEINLVLFWNPQGEGYRKVIDSLRNEYKGFLEKNNIGIVLVCTNKDKEMWMSAVSSINEPSWIYLQDRLELKVLDSSYLIKDKKPWIFLMTRESLMIGSRFHDLQMIETYVQYYQKNRNTVFK